MAAKMAPQYEEKDAIALIHEFGNYTQTENYQRIFGKELVAEIRKFCADHDLVILPSYAIPDPRRKKKVILVERLN